MKKGYLAPILVTVGMLVYLGLYTGVLLWLPMPVFWKAVLAVAPLGGGCVMIHVCRQRILELKKGEENDLSQY